METIKVKAQVASTSFDRTNERFTPEALASIAAQAEGKEIFWAFDYERPCGKILAVELIDDRVTVEAELHGVQAIAFARLCDEKERNEGKSAGYIVPGFHVLESENEVGDAEHPFIRVIKRVHLAAFGLVPEPADQSLESVKPITNCHICGKVLDIEDDPLTFNCGGDCTECMARAGDPDELKSVIDALVGQAYEIGHAHGGNAYREPQRVDEGWGPVAEKLFEIVREAGNIQPTSKSQIADLPDEPKLFIQSCEHGKLSGQHCFICKRSVPYGPKPE